MGRGAEGVMADVSLELIAANVQKLREEMRDGFDSLGRRIKRIEERMDGQGVQFKRLADSSAQEFRNIQERLDGLSSRIDGTSHGEPGA
jgi:hypothetical protein